MLTIYGENDLVFEALCAGACGYLLKNTPPARFHIRNIYQKLHVQMQSEAVATAIRKGLI